MLASSGLSLAFAGSVFLGSCLLIRAKGIFGSTVRVESYRVCSKTTIDGHKTP